MIHTNVRHKDDRVREEAALVVVVMKTRKMGSEVFDHTAMRRLVAVAGLETPG